MDGHKQIDKKNSHNIISNDLNEEEYCQICGDLASGWHCGYVNKNWYERFCFSISYHLNFFRAITCEACKVTGILKELFYFNFIR